MCRIFRVVAGLTMAGLLGLTTACASGDDSGSAGGAEATAASGNGTATAAAAEKPSGKKVDATVSGKGMKGGCQAVRKAFTAIEAGDLTTANSLRDQGAVLFDDVAAEYATKDLDLAMDGATMGSEMDYELPTDPTKYRSNLAKQYAAICVAKYQAAALAG